VEANVWQQQRMPVVEGIEIEGEHPEADGIAAVRTMQAVFVRVAVRRARHGIHLYDRNRNVIVSDCHLYGNRGVGLFLDQVDLHQINVGDSHISYNAGGGIVVLGGNVRNMQVGACDIESNMGKDSPPTANILIDTTGGSMAEAAIVGCTLQHNHDAPGSANIRILGAGGLATRGQAPGNITIADNVLSDVFVSIHLREVRGVTIVGNTIWKGFAHDIHIEKSTKVLIGANILDRNPAYRPDDSPNGILIEDSADCQLNGVLVSNTLSADAGIVLRRCKRFNVTNCSILDCAHGGLLLDDVEATRVSGCLIASAASAFVPLRLTRGRNNMLVSNLLQGECRDDTGAAHIAENAFYVGD
jgi:hypothetical protein